MNSRGDDARRAYPCALTDAMWQVVSAHLPVQDTTKGGRPLKHGHRLIIDTILYVLVSGCAWRLVPHDGGADLAAIQPDPTGRAAPGWAGSEGRRL